jgi:UDP-N-acetylmuramyl pentapeptide phosphotransferase/UDP-N-acetylglucosamine-1-phosphate transferase
VTALIISFWLSENHSQITRAANYTKLEAPKTHLIKAGTPTMGGLIVLLLLFRIALTDLKNVYILLSFG